MSSSSEEEEEEEGGRLRRNVLRAAIPQAAADAFAVAMASDGTALLVA